MHAGSSLATLRAHKALRSAVGRSSDHGDFAGADAYSVLLLVLAVGAARVGVAWITLLDDRHTGWNQRALGDGISGVAVETGTDGLVTESVADGVDTADSRTRVHTLVVDTGAVAGTVCVEHTLGSAGQVGVAEVTRNTVTCSGSLS